MKTHFFLLQNRIYYTDDPTRHLNDTVTVVVINQLLFWNMKNAVREKMRKWILIRTHFLLALHRRSRLNLHTFSIYNYTTTMWYLFGTWTARPQPALEKSHLYFALNARSVHTHHYHDDLFSHLFFFLRCTRVVWWLYRVTPKNFEDSAGCLVNTRKVDPKIRFFSVLSSILYYAIQGLRAIRNKMKRGSTIVHCECEGSKKLFEGDKIKLYGCAQ